MSTAPIVIAAAARTPIGAFQGELAPLTAPGLGAAAIRAALGRARVAPEDVTEVALGNVLPAGLGQAPARQAALGAGLPDTVPCTTVSKVCGSGMRAVMLARDALRAEDGEGIWVVGGMESMTNAPYLLPKARGGFRLGHGEVKDHMFLDGLEDAYEPGRLMGTFAEDTARHYQFNRAMQDDYAAESLARAQAALRDGAFAEEIAPVAVTSRTGTESIADDEGPRTLNVEKIPKLKPAFAKDGTVTAANASSISDGAAALVMMSEATAMARGAPVLARIVAQAGHAQAPAWFTTAPVPAIRRVVERAGWALSDVDLFEINEAFAVVPLAAMAELGIARDRINVHGGACALGHPIGASGARIIVTLLHALRRSGGRRGVASLCIGGGEATAVAVELM